MDSIAEHLMFGDSRAAVVISIYPKLIVAAYSGGHISWKKAYFRLKVAISRLSWKPEILD